MGNFVGGLFLRNNRWKILSCLFCAGYEVHKGRGKYMLGKGGIFHILIYPAEISFFVRQKYVQGPHINQLNSVGLQQVSDL